MTPLALAAAYLAFYILGIYRGIWQYVGLDDLARYARAATGSAVLVAPPVLFFFREQNIPGVIFFLFGIFLFLGLVASRASFRFLDTAYSRRQSSKKKNTVLIYGADDAGEIVLQWLQRNTGLGYEPAGFLDDDPFKWGRRIHGLSVLGGANQFKSIMDSKNPDGIILISSTLLESSEVRQVISTCRARGIWVKVLKLDFLPVEEGRVVSKD
jgi:FlaA1/EpsC-like NDP-sugar epimerase